MRSAAAATTTLAPAVSGVASPPPPLGSSQEAHNQDEDIEMVQRDLPSTEPVFEELDFGAAWREALQNRPPPATVEELKTLQEEIALLESALQLCQTMPCAGEQQEDAENRQVEHNKQHPSTSGISLNEKTAAAAMAAAAAPGRKQARKLSELASQQHLNNSAHGTEEEKEEIEVVAEQIADIPSTKDTAIEEGRDGVDASAGAATAETEKESSPLRDGETRFAKRPRVEQHPMAAFQASEERNQGAVGKLHYSVLGGRVPDSQPTSGGGEEKRGNSLPQVETNTTAAAAAAAPAAGHGSNNGVMLLGSAATLNTQSAAELLHGIGAGHNNGFIPASQLPLGGDGASGADGNGGGTQGAAEPAIGTGRVKETLEEPIQPFSLAFPAPAPRSQSQIVSASPFFNNAGASSGAAAAAAAAGPLNTTTSFNNLNHSSKSSGQHRSNPTTSHSGKGTGSNKTTTMDIRTMIRGQKAAQEASTAAASSQAPICVAFAQSDQQLKSKVQAVQRKLPTLTYMHYVSEATTHVIVATDDSLIAEKRSRIYLEGLARGCWVVSTAWLEACFDTGMRVKENIYEVKGCPVPPSRFYQDDWLAANVLGGPERCRLLAKHGLKLFSTFGDIRVERFDEKSKNAGKLREIVLCLLRFAGATVTESGPLSKDALVVTNDRNVAGGFQKRNFKRVVDSRWVLDSVSCCKVLPEERYLFKMELE